MGHLQGRFCYPSIRLLSAWWWAQGA